MADLSIERASEILAHAGEDLDAEAAVTLERVIGQAAKAAEFNSPALSAELESELRGVLGEGGAEVVDAVRVLGDHVAELWVQVDGVVGELAADVDRAGLELTRDAEGGRLVRSVAEARMSIALAEELRCYLRELRRRREPRVEVARG